MGQITLNKPSGGQLTIAPEDGTSNETVSIPASGYFNDKVPVFSAYVDGQLTFSSGSDIKIPFTLTDQNDGNVFDTTTNTFTPNIAGWYELSFAVNVDLLSGSSGRTITHIRKNGVSVIMPIMQTLFLDDRAAASGSFLVYMNGTTDYIYMTSYSEGGTPRFNGWTGTTINGTPASNTRLQGFLIKEDI